MYIAPKFSLKKVTIDGISLVLNSEEARELKKKYPEAEIQPLRSRTGKGRSRSLRSPAAILSPLEYAQLKMQEEVIQHGC